VYNMNCQEFEATILDLEELPAEALAHAELCAHCAALVTDHRRLANGLRAWRAATAGAQAPDRVLVSLQTAFHARRQKGSTSPAPTRARWMLAAAAAFCILLGLTAGWMIRPRGRVQDPVEPMAQPVIRQALPPAGEAQPVTVARQPRRTARPLAKPKPAAPIVEDEVVTDFLPLDEGASLAPIESAQIVRVRLARAALARFGLPVNENRMTEPVKADVVFGQDGIARAIRFVK
jgi:hypothetical protein